MEHLRDGIGLRGYGQREPKNEYKKEGYDLSLNMTAKISSTVLSQFFAARALQQDLLEQPSEEAILQSYPNTSDRAASPNEL